MPYFTLYEISPFSNESRHDSSRAAADVPHHESQSAALFAEFMRRLSCHISSLSRRRFIFHTHFGIGWPRSKPAAATLLLPRLFRFQGKISASEQLLPGFIGRLI